MTATTLVVGATGATGRLLVQQLLDRGHAVRAIVRSAGGLPAPVRHHPAMTVVEAGISTLADARLAEIARGCDAVASCLGHRVSFKGIFGPPYRLVTTATRRLCASVRANAPARPVRFVLMSSAGVGCPGERKAIGEKFVDTLLRTLVPPHADNIRAAAYLRESIGPTDAHIEWAAVRPDSLFDAAEPTHYEVHPAPVRSALFDPGRTSRINVAHFMATLVSDDAAWATWKGRLPVIYNTTGAVAG